MNRISTSLTKQQRAEALIKEWFRCLERVYGDVPKGADLVEVVDVMLIIFAAIATLPQAPPDIRQYILERMHDHLQITDAIIVPLH